MTNEILRTPKDSLIHYQPLPEFLHSVPFNNIYGNIKKGIITEKETPLPEVLFITSYPPRECGIATYSHDLMNALNRKFSNTFSLKVCALESENENYKYPQEVKYVLDTSGLHGYAE